MKESKLAVPTRSAQYEWDACPTLLWEEMWKSTIWMVDQSDTFFSEQSYWKRKKILVPPSSSLLTWYIFVWLSHKFTPELSSTSDTKLKTCRRPQTSHKLETKGANNKDIKSERLIVLKVKHDQSSELYGGWWYSEQQN